WRPTIALTQYPDVVIDRLELLYIGERHLGLVGQIGRDVASVSPDTVVRPHDLPIQDPWDFGEVYANLLDFARAYPFDTDNEEYWIH
ncbi:RNA repair transcriptional activator RtcR family protein, partial [Acinetobacter baumannii]